MDTCPATRRTSDVDRLGLFPHMVHRLETSFAGLRERERAECALVVPPADLEGNPGWTVEISWFPEPMASGVRRASQRRPLLGFLEFLPRYISPCWHVQHR